MSEHKLIAVLIDVSGSMKESFQREVNFEQKHDISRIQSVIKTLYDIFKKENDPKVSKKVFSLAFGLSMQEMNVCDLVSFLPFVVTLKKTLDTKSGKINLNIFLKSKNVKYAEEFINKHLSEEECAYIYALSCMPKNESRVQQIINSLPNACKNPVAKTVNGTILGAFGILPNFMNPTVDLEAKTTREVAEQAKNDFLQKIQIPELYDVEEAISILDNIIGGDTTNNVILNHIEPYIFGSTPMCKALDLTTPFFKSSYYKDKILFLITDGEATDGDPSKYARTLKDMNVTVVICLITDYDLQNPRQLFYKSPNNWSPTAKSMFDMSTTVDNFNPFLSVLLDRGWQLALEGESKLFFQANHPDHISEISEIISAKSNDKLLNIMTRAALEDYINLDVLREKKTISAPDQKNEKTCYAQACAYAIYLATLSVYEREGEAVTFSELREKMIQEHGKDRAKTREVLEKFCTIHRLQCREVNEEGAKIAISKRRPVVARYRLTAKQQIDFSYFYEEAKTGILRKSNLQSQENDQKFGHAVILVKVTPEYLLFMNSRGSDFADDGFFRVENAEVLGVQFFEVFWTEENLTARERYLYKEWKKSGTSLIDKIPESIKSLPYTCPRCRMSSMAKEFKGNFQIANCPKCNQYFVPLLLNFAMFNNIYQS